jgi:hypothetical protein
MKQDLPPNHKELLARVLASTGTPDPALLLEVQSLPPEKVAEVTLAVLRKVADDIERASTNVVNEHLATNTASKLATLDLLARMQLSPDEGH